LCCAVYVQAYGYELPKDIQYVYTNVRKTHNSGVFDAYTDEMKRARKSGILTGEADTFFATGGSLSVDCGSSGLPRQHM
jgi:pyruvate-formate lyase